jgi:hypothetical protein
MSLTLAWRLNYRLVELSGTPGGESVGVLLRNDEYRYVPWLGFIDRKKAAYVGKSVRLRIDRIGRLQGVTTVWEELPAGKHVQGCLTERGAFAVIEDSVRLV